MFWVDRRPAVLLVLTSSALMIAILFCVATLIGCGKEEAKKPSTQPNMVQTQPSTLPGSSTQAAPIMLSGSTDQASQPFNLTKGVAVSTMRYSGGTKFEAVLLDSTGKQVDVLADVTTNLTGSTATGVAGGQYSVSVVAAGPWEIDIEQGQPGVVPYIPLLFTGTEPVATEFFQSSGGDATVQMSFSGNGSFTVKMLSSSGETVKVLEDATGPVDNTMTMPLETGVAYLIDVEGVGPWTVKLQ